MRQPVVDQSVLTDVSWWHWTLTVPLLAISLAGRTWAAVAAMALCAAAGGYFFVRLRQIRPYPVQVRIAYLVLLMAGVVPGMQWVHGVQLAGTTAMVTVGYCPLLRTLRLLPFNRTGPFTWTLLYDAFLRWPCDGGLLQLSGSSPEGNITGCSLRQAKASASCSLTPRPTNAEDIEPARSR